MTISSVDQASAILCTRADARRILPCQLAPNFASDPALPDARVAKLPGGPRQWQSPSVLPRAFLLLLLGVAAGCGCVSPHVSGAPSTPPDEQYQTGTTHGYDLFVWKCAGGAHVVISQKSGEMFCGRPQLERTACGRRTDLEIEVAGDVRRPISRW